MPATWPLERVLPVRNPGSGALWALIHFRKGHRARLGGCQGQELWKHRAQLAEYWRENIWGGWETCFRVELSWVFWPGKGQSLGKCRNSRAMPTQMANIRAIPTCVFHLFLIISMPKGILFFVNKDDKQSKL